MDQTQTDVNGQQWWQGLLGYVVTAATDANFRPGMSQYQRYEIGPNGQLIMSGQPTSPLGQTVIPAIDNTWLLIGGVALLVWMIK